MRVTIINSAPPINHWCPGMYLVGSVRIELYYRDSNLINPGLYPHSYVCRIYTSKINAAFTFDGILLRPCRLPYPFRLYSIHSPSCFTIE